jgi:hypothetical protein
MSRSVGEPLALCTPRARSARSWSSTQVRSIRSPRQRWGFFASTPLSAGHHHIDCVTPPKGETPLAAPATGTDEPTSPLGNGSLGAVSSRHFGWRSHLGWLLQELWHQTMNRTRAAECHCPGWVHFRVYACLISRLYRGILSWRLGLSRGISSNKQWSSDKYTFM